jgi:hypothetical protein
VHGCEKSSKPPGGQSFEFVVRGVLVCGTYSATEKVYYKRAEFLSFILPSREKM